MTTIQSIIVGAALASAAIFLMREGPTPAMAQLEPQPAVVQTPDVGLYELIALSNATGVRLNTATGQLCLVTLNPRPMEAKGAIVLRCGYVRQKDTTS